jgi:hypothetical protein
VVTRASIRVLLDVVCSVYNESKEENDRHSMSVEDIDVGIRSLIVLEDMNDELK